eukprot:gene15455-11053_t
MSARTAGLAYVSDGIPLGLSTEKEVQNQFSARLWPSLRTERAAAGFCCCCASYVARDGLAHDVREATLGPDARLSDGFRVRRGVRAAGAEAVEDEQRPLRRAKCAYDRRVAPGLGAAGAGGGGGAGLPRQGGVRAAAAAATTTIDSASLAPLVTRLTTTSVAEASDAPDASRPNWSTESTKGRGAARGGGGGGGR